MLSAKKRKDVTQFSPLMVKVSYKILPYDDKHVKRHVKTLNFYRFLVSLDTLINNSRVSLTYNRIHECQWQCITFNSDNFRTSWQKKKRIMKIYDLGTYLAPDNTNPEWSLSLAHKCHLSFITPCRVWICTKAKSVASTRNQYINFGKLHAIFEIINVLNDAGLEACVFYLQQIWDVIGKW